MRAVLLDTDSGRRVPDALRALRATGPELEFLVVSERATREETLNRALEVAGRDDHLVLVADDIVPTPGWGEALRAGFAEAHVLGFSMLHAPSGPVQDRGFDLVEIDGELLLEARDRGADPARLPAFAWRPCDAVCGCFLALHRDVLARIPGFSPDGSNRWGEMLFCVAARKVGFRVGVLGHYLVHRGGSTKRRAVPALSSESRDLERRLWRERVLPHLAGVRPRRRLRRALDPASRQALAHARGPVLVYGAGTAADLVAEALGNRVPVTFCTGLRDEVGRCFRGHRVVDVDGVDPARFAWIVMTPRSRPEEIFLRRIRPRLSSGFRGRVSVVAVGAQDDELRYALSDLEVGGEGLDPPVGSRPTEPGSPMDPPTG